MHLKCLEIHGFKSFAEKTRLEFGPGITVIVGPNGSGKSNVSDAIRWVLGEQSLKNLRGAKMEDIIFNGSERRKALGMAEVTLTLDNSAGVLPLEYTEVTVSRRVYRSGDSEFFINKMPCRLKDLQDLFNDTGLGKEAFAIIGQGQVEAILNSRPEERRALFEEAAGIVRYRNRKREAEKKLENTEISLDRLQDILFELESNLTPLREEAEKAGIYQELKSELDRLEINLIALDVEQLKIKKDEVSGAETQLQLTLVRQEAVQAKCETKLEEIKFDRKQLEEKTAVKKDFLYQLTNNLERTEGKIALEEEKLRGAREQQKKLQEESETYQIKLEQLQKGFQAEETELQRLQQCLESQQETDEEIARDLAICQKDLAINDAQAEDLKNGIFDVEQKAAHVKNRLLELSFEQRNWKQKQQKLNEEFFSKNEIAVHLSQLQEELTKKIDQEHLELEDCLQKRRETEEELVQKQDLAVQIRQKIDQVRQTWHTINSRLQILNEMKASHEGYGIGVKNILKGQAGQQLSGVIGVAGELIHVPSKYEKAVETALGGAIQNIVTEKDTDAREAIAWLKKNNAGRATFLPLNYLQTKKISKDHEKLLAERGVLGLASDLVEIETKYQAVVNHLLGAVIVVSDLDKGLEIAKKSRFSVKIVTLGGEILYPGGSLTGGHYKKENSGLLSRSREIKKNNEQLTQLDQKLLDLEKQLEDLLGRSRSLNGVLDQLKHQESQLKVQIYSLEQERLKAEEQFQGEQKNAVRLAWEKDQLANEHDQLLGEQQRLENQLAESEKKKAELAAKITKTNKIINSIKQKIKSLEQKSVALKVELAASVEKKRSLEGTLTYYYQNRNEIENHQNRIARELALLEDKAADAAKELSQARQLLDDMIIKKEQAVKENALLVKNKQELEKICQDLETEAVMLAKKLQKTKDDLHKAEMKIARLEVEWENVVGRLHEKFGINLEEAVKLRSEIGPRNQAEDRVKILKQEIERIGPVNLLAIEEYKRLNERYLFLKKQQQDLVAAKEGLFQIITEMETTMSQRFAKTFAAIQEAFQKIFSFLFSGGQASLEFTEPDNLLGTGIEITAQPLGKKMQSLSLLSGGERALTAIALLFAILRIKPSPFCVLDEIEAALDEANVDRFANFLQQFINQTQFIIVSHRQGTMEVADALYGVTMEESGVSKLVSVKLVNAVEKVG